jgi:hypothetical protein
MLKVDPIILAKAIEATPDSLVIVFDDRKVAIPWARCSARLAKANQPERLNAELSPGGYGVHWPLLDEDLSIGGLLRKA